jgi:hypothetical protein
MIRKQGCVEMVRNYAGGRDLLPEITLKKTVVG